MKSYIQKILIPAAICLLGSFSVLPAQETIGGATAHPSALLDVQTVAGGVLLPRMSTAERSAIVQPAAGLMLFNTTLNCLELNLGTPSQPAWNCLGATNTVTAASASPNLCVNTALTPITHKTTGATGIGSATNLPPGVSPVWASNTITISGTPTAAGTYNYAIPLTGGVGSVQATGTIIVSAANTVGTASSSPTLCVNTTLTPITHSTIGATGIGSATNLPSGVSPVWASNTITISGTPTAAGTYIYSIPLTGGCGSVSATGTIIVSAANTAGTASSTPTLNANTALTPITHSTTGATGIGSATNLPTGVSASWASNTITISGTPTASGTFNYSIPLTGGCGSVSATGTITVNAVVNCGAYIASGVWKAFKCHNLGADESAAPFTASWRLIGNYYQWGRGVVAANGPTGSSSGQANDGVIAGWNTSAASNGAWSDATKTANDPCPSGFRLPTKAQWDAVVNTSLNPTRDYPGSWSINSTNYSTGLQIGTVSNGLFLPAAGYRHENDGALNHRGNLGRYWSSTENGSEAWSLHFGNGNANPNGSYRTLGFSVRCIAE